MGLSAHIGDVGGYLMCLEICLVSQVFLNFSILYPLVPLGEFYLGSPGDVLPRFQGRGLGSW